MSDKTISRNGGQDFLVYREGSGDTVEIFDIAVMTERRVGIGRGMVNELLNRYSAGTVVWAITRHDNLIAQEFYEEMHFKVVGVLRGFYRTDPSGRRCVDAVMYGRCIGDQS